MNNFTRDREIMKYNQIKIQELNNRITETKNSTDAFNKD